LDGFHGNLVVDKPQKLRDIHHCPFIHKERKKKPFKQQQKSLINLKICLMGFYYTVSLSCFHCWFSYYPFFQASKKNEKLKMTDDPKQTRN
jgi:hypothetical protein